MSDRPSAVSLSRKMGHAGPVMHNVADVGSIPSQGVLDRSGRTAWRSSADRGEANVKRQRGQHICSILRLTGKDHEKSIVEAGTVGLSDQTANGRA